ncbi:CaiB/BaiF CoA transferase family protein [Chloroflexota bacterium]
MSDQQEPQSSLSPYRILDLTEAGCMITGKMLGDLGADVIKIEPPEGSHSRIAPFYKDIPDPEKSLFWFAYNTNKRGITLDLQTVNGQDILKRLVKTADVVIESFEPGYMEQIGLGYSSLRKIKPDLIMTSITPFGQSGPKAHYRQSELTMWASGGYLYLSGAPEYAPVWISFPQACLFGGVEATTGTMTALWHRQNTGIGQHVDVSIQECIIIFTWQTIPMWDLNNVDYPRLRTPGMMVPTTGVVGARGIYRCVDGHVVIMIQGGDEPFPSSMKSLVKLMDKDGMADDWLKQIDWRRDYDALKLNQDLVNRVEGAIKNFLATKTKKYLYNEANKSGILLAPIATIKDIWENPQLEARNFWVPVAHPELDDTLTYCGPFIKLSESPVEYRRRAPLIGEHNTEIYGKDLGLTKEELVCLKQDKVI